MKILLSIYALTIIVSYFSTRIRIKKDYLYANLFALLIVFTPIFNLLPLIFNIIYMFYDKDMRFVKKFFNVK
jgi:hypothetical protein